MNEDAKIVLNYLLDNGSVGSVGIFVDRLIEIAESYETVPEEVLEAYGKLSETEKWEVVEQVVIKGKLNTIWTK